MATNKPKFPQEFTSSVSEQAGMLRSRIPTPMIKALKAGHGDAIHFTVEGPDSIEVKVLRDRGFSGGKPLPRPKVEAPKKKKAAAPAPVAKKKSKVVAKGNGTGKKKVAPPTKKKANVGAKKKVKYSNVDDLF